MRVELVIRSAVGAALIVIGAATAEARAQDAAKKPDAPEPAVFEMKDGARLIGPVDIERVKIKTAYGMLEVPVREIFSVRFGRRCDPALVARVEKLVGQLGDGDFTVRNEATDALVEEGVAARPELEKALESTDLEVKSRARKILDRIAKKLSEDDATDALEYDEILTSQFPIKGCVEIESFRVTTKYGPLEVKKGDVVRIQFHEPDRIQKTIQVPASACAQGAWKDTGIRIKKGQVLKISASGTISVPNYGITVGPDGQPGNTWMANFPIGSLVGQIGADGSAFQLGADSEHIAEKDGNLLLGVAAPNRGNTGTFKVKVEIEAGED